MNVPEIVNPISYDKSLTAQEIALRRKSRTYEANDLAFGPKTHETMKSIVADCNELEAWQDKLGS